MSHHLPGAVTVYEWCDNDNGRCYRNSEGEIRESPTDNKCGDPVVGVYAYGVQHDDVTVADGAEPTPGVAIQVRGGDHHRGEALSSPLGPVETMSLSSAAARRLADNLVMAADEVDRWEGTGSA